MRASGNNNTANEASPPASPCAWNEYAATKSNQTTIKRSSSIMFRGYMYIKFKRKVPIIFKYKSIRRQARLPKVLTVRNHLYYLFSVTLFLVLIFFWHLRNVSTYMYLGSLLELMSLPVDKRVAWIVGVLSFQFALACNLDWIFSKLEEDWGE